MEKNITFGSNLKYYRTKLNLTQKQLADKIGYTEKSVSKWEKAVALPTIEVLVRLADLFCVSLDELMFAKTSSNYFLGIDGGGTKTVFKLVDENGIAVETIYKGACNPNDIGMTNAMTLLKEGINETCKGIPYSKITMFAGLSGGGLSGDNVNVLKKFFDKFGFYAFENGSDIENIAALSDYPKCILVIMGTGFIVFALGGEERKRIAGWGQFFDEGGSGYTLGRDVITAVLNERDGSGPRTMLTGLLEKQLGETAEAHLAKFYQGGKRYIASFADLAFRAAESGDEIAFSILDKNMAYAAGKIDTAAVGLREKGSPEEIPVLFSGGISTKKEILFPLIENHLQDVNCRLIRLEQQPVDGAVRKAQKIYECKGRASE